MIGLDTNVVIRYITQDDEAQALKATQVIENEISSKNPGFITLITLIEISWGWSHVTHRKRKVS
jgi:predicted nucleic-acid-binding protein